MNEFEHERLDVYKAAIELLVLADAVAATLPRARGYLVPFGGSCIGFGARRTALGAQRPVLGARCSAPGARRPVLGARRSALGAQRSALGAQRPALGAQRSALGARRPAPGAPAALLRPAHEPNECGDEVVHFVQDDVIGRLQVSPGLGDVERSEGFAGRTKRGFIASASSASRTACTFRQVEQDTCGGTPELTGEVSVVRRDACSDWTKPDQHATSAFINRQVRCGSDVVHALGLSASVV
jgi:hypothetical protein